MILGRKTAHWYERRTESSLMKLAGRLSKGLLGDINKETHLINKKEEENIRRKERKIISNGKDMRSKKK